MVEQLKVTVEKGADYTHYNFALFQGGLDNLFDLLRYDRAFFARRSDVAAIIATLESGNPWASLPILLCKYAWTKKANWTHGKLGARDIITHVDPSYLYELDSSITIAKPQQKLKHRVTLHGYKGTLPEILGVMFDNLAMPATEKDANIIESCYYDLDKVVEVDLTTFQAVANYKFVVE